MFIEKDLRCHVELRIPVYRKLSLIFPKGESAVVNDEKRPKFLSLVRRKRKYRTDMEN